MNKICYFFFEVLSLSPTGKNLSSIFYPPKAKRLLGGMESLSMY